MPSEHFEFTTDPDTPIRLGYEAAWEALEGEIDVTHLLVVTHGVDPSTGEVLTAFQFHGNPRIVAKLAASVSNVINRTLPNRDPDDQVEDATCKCRHARSYHNVHGACTSCSCTQFTPFTSPE